MSRRKPAWLLERELKEAQDRENYYRTRTRTPKTTVTSRKTKTYYYRSVSILSGSSGQLYDLAIGNKVIPGVLAIGDVNLLDQLPANENSRPSKNSGMTPGMLHAYKGQDVPTAKTTAWGTRWIKYYADSSGTAQSHISCPISGTGTTPTEAQARNAFRALIANGGKITNWCGENGRAYYTPEQIPLSFNG